MLKADAKPFGQRFQAESRSAGPTASGDRSRAGELQIGDTLPVGTEAGEQHADIEAGVVGYQAVVVQTARDLGPQLSEGGFRPNVGRREPVDPGIRLTEPQRLRPNQPDRRIGDAARSDLHRRELAGAVLPTAGGLEIDGGEICCELHAAGLRNGPRLLLFRLLRS